MSWPAKLYDTYEHCFGNPKFADEEHQLLPLSHSRQYVHIKVTLDGQGNFKDAEVLEKQQMTLPATQESANRTSSVAPHALIDTMEYCAGDYANCAPLDEKSRSKAEEKNKSFMENLEAWVKSENSHPKVEAVATYLRKNSLTKDLIDKKILPTDESGQLLLRWAGPDKPPIFQSLGNQEPGKALVCWRVEIPGQVNAETWTDESLHQAWSRYYSSIIGGIDLCLISGQETTVAKQHPKYIRWPGDGAKLISGNDNSGFTFRGRFNESSEAAAVGYEASQKAHSALRWLLARQGFRNASQMVVAWAVQGKEIPQLMERDFFNDEDSLIITDEDESPADIASGETRMPASTPALAGDAGEMFSRRLAGALKGYSQSLEPTDEIVIIGLDSATPGRLSVTFYREKTVDQYLEAIGKWQQDLAWFFRRKNAEGRWGFTLRAPAPVEIAEAAYGRRLDDQLKKATVERLLPVISDALPLPLDLMKNTFHRAVRPHSFDQKWEWENTLTVACALYRGFYARHKTDRRIYAMSLETERSSRDYLFGRLLAVAESLESLALWSAGENRTTNAERLMQRFADRPCSTWRTIELALSPYRQRLAGGRYSGLAAKREQLIDDILARFESPEDFAGDQRLSGEFLLGYHCQRQALRPEKTTKTAEENAAGEAADAAGQV